jgi:hypothetical protein
MNLPRPPYRFPYRSPEEETRVAQWIEEYDQQARHFATCEVVGQFGSHVISPDVEPSSGGPRSLCTQRRSSAGVNHFFARGIAKFTFHLSLPISQKAVFRVEIAPTGSSKNVRPKTLLVKTNRLWRASLAAFTDNFSESFQVISVTGEDCSVISIRHQFKPFIKNKL